MNNAQSFQSLGKRFALFLFLALAGCGTGRDGPGKQDHIAWVTMTDEGPVFANIALRGIFDKRSLGQ